MALELVVFLWGMLCKLGLVYTIGNLMLKDIIPELTIRQYIQVTFAIHLIINLFSAIDVITK